MIIKPKKYKIEDFSNFLNNSKSVVLSNLSSELIKKSRVSIEKAIKEENTIYGVNTGFGKLSQIKIKHDQISKLQENLILSHATGLGQPVNDTVVKLILLTKIISLSMGYSGVRISIVNFLVNLLNNNIYPVIPCQGSVGASGDLAPLAHLALPMLGLSKVRYKGKIYKSITILKKFNLKPIKLSYKEGLALINGTQFSLSFGILAAIQSKKIIKNIDIVGAISADSLYCSDKSFLNIVHELKPHKGQIDSATNIYNLLKNSKIKDFHNNKYRVQDMYSIRCMPHVHGACRETLKYFYNIIETEINSVSDNPLVFNKEKIISAGHFHAQAIGQAMDSAAIAITTLGNICERRISTLVNGDFGLPPFLVKNAGLNSGFMITQITAAAIASENKCLANPSTVDSIPTGANQEDFVSMAPFAGRKLLNIVNNVEYILAIELLTSLQAIDFRKNLKSSTSIEAVRVFVRKYIKHLVKDKYMEEDLNKSIEIIKNGEIINVVENIISLK